MAQILKAFHSNPALGGFGNESGASESVKEGDCDAFAQIVKELVDNAVDACRFENSDRIRRVRVDFSQVSPTILRVTVTDNGCGMSCIQDCVEAFRSTKGDSAVAATTPTSIAKTAGRYGIGLTLCLLHAQRLVPNSRASITSATEHSPFFQTADYIVDTESDCIKCIPGDNTPKSSPTESGTSVSLLVPGGPMAHRAWPRLAEYFARFQLSLGLPCSLQVMAPTLSKVPLFIQSPLEQTCKKDKTIQRSKPIVEQALDDDWNPDGSGTDSGSDSSVHSRHNICLDIQKAVSSFLRRNVDLKNVAHSIQPIRSGKRRTKNSPTLEVDIVVYNTIVDDHENEEDAHNLDMPSAKMTLVRMVNRIPLLDGAEASACGLVQCLASKKSMWSSFGLSVSLGTPVAVTPLRLFVPTYAVRDSDNVASFFQHRSPHQLFQMHNIQEMVIENTSVKPSEKSDDFRDPSRTMANLLLPAHLRLGSILVIIQIHARPSSLPLPTLSKGRLPLNDAAIDMAVENGVTACLKSLQITNPELLLTPQKVKATMRDARYVPSSAAAMACVICKSKNDDLKKHALKVIDGWCHRKTNEKSTRDYNLQGVDLDMLEVTQLGPLIEAKLREISAKPAEDKTRPPNVTVASKMITRGTSRKSDVLPLSSPLKRDTSAYWSCMSPTPVKKSRRRITPSLDKNRGSGETLGPRSWSSPFHEQSTVTLLEEL